MDNTTINFEITHKELKFLQTLAEKHMPGMPDNRHTADPIHVVEKKKYEYVPYFDGSSDWYGEYPLVMTADDDYEIWYEDETELVKDYMDNNIMDEAIQFPIMSYENLEYQTITRTDGIEIYIDSWEDYFEAYGITLKAIAWKKAYWEPAAHFFIYEEAERYRSYQKHNLGISRVYTHSMGYSNNGDLPVFRDLLLRMGHQLNQGDE